MTDTTLTDRLAAVEARLAELERLLVPPPIGRVKFAPQTSEPPEVTAWLKRIGADRRPMGSAALRQKQIDEGADPNSTFCREEIERMREE